LAEAAVFLRNGQAEQAHLLHALDDVRRVGVGVLQLLGVRDDLLVHEVADGRQDFLLDVGQACGLGKAGHAALLRARACWSRLITPQYPSPTWWREVIHAAE